MGLPLNDDNFYINIDNHEISPVDEETKQTIKELMTIFRRSEASIIITII